VHHETALTAL